ncbi:ORC-CDC6 family AAA ATPase [Chryseolinea lacunae]|uniref:ATP-binding protein n=1 Tax=Chryseolinea lacunae TaxID=2801331 RepID=A0ABS1L2R0_9BACT|nr:hypothetical protein [Chryseolinea lacunae]MBL0745965.1 hypothetical protein [Chryseolinea lacunae]
MSNYKDGPLAKNRAEELGYDLWEKFVIPPFFDQLDLIKAKKPRVIIGGRGCGKTMLLRYLSHQTMFSQSRKELSAEDFLHVGLYWRVDTQFVSMMSKRNKEEEEWRPAFEHMTSLLIGLEILKSLETISSSSFDSINYDKIRLINFSQLKNFDSELPADFDTLKNVLLNKLWQFESWLNNINRLESPIFLSKRFLEALIKIITEQVAVLKNSVFSVYLDEYENLLPYQQRIINTWLKHSEAPLVFNLAMKRNAFKERRTIGNEALSDIHDYRLFDLEIFYEEEQSFDVFAAEILIIRLLEYGLKNSPVLASDLRDVSKLQSRKTDAYKKTVLSFANRVFPSVPPKQVAAEMINDKVLSDRVIKQIESALQKKNSLSIFDQFVKDTPPEALVVLPALLNREKARPEDILVQLNKLKAGEDNKFSGDTGWIHNNLFGCILYMYEPLNRICPLYSGFKTFCKMSHGNIRHLIELCHKSISRADISLDDFFSGQSITIREQADAALQASTAFLGEIKTFGKHGNQLHAFVMRIGTIFHQAHKRPAQSEPEQNHFSISKGSKQLTDEQENFLEEATKWSVLFETKSTKQKSDLHLEDSEYVLNPIYAPYFHISYRKKRKLDFRTDEFATLTQGSLQEFESLLKRYIKEWNVDVKESPMTLFSGLKLF